MYAFPPLQLILPLLERVRQLIIPHYSGSGEPLSSVVSRVGSALTDGTVAGTVQIGCAFTGPQPWDSGPVAPERLILQGKGFPEAVINIIQSACAPSTSSLYAA